MSREAVADAKGAILIKEHALDKTSRFLPRLSRQVSQIDYLT